MPVLIPFIIRGANALSAEQRKDLAALAAAFPSYATPIFIIHCYGLADIPELILSDPESAPWRDECLLVLADDPERLKL